MTPRTNSDRGAPVGSVRVQKPLWLVKGQRKGRSWSFAPRADTREAAIKRAQAVSFHPLTVESCERINEFDPTPQATLRADRGLDRAGEGR